MIPSLERPILPPLPSRPFARRRESYREFLSPDSPRSPRDPDDGSCNLDDRRPVTKTNGRSVGNERETGQSKTRVLFVRLLSARRKSRQETSANTIPATFAPDDSLHESRARIKRPSLWILSGKMEFQGVFRTQRRNVYHCASDILVNVPGGITMTLSWGIFDFLTSFLKKSQEQRVELLNILLYCYIDFGEKYHLTSCAYCQ